MNKARYSLCIVCLCAFFVDVNVQTNVYVDNYVCNFFCVNRAWPQPVLLKPPNTSTELGFAEWDPRVST